MNGYPQKPFSKWQQQGQAPYNKPFPMLFDDTLTQLQKMNMLMKSYQLLQDNFITMQDYMDAVTAFIESEYDKNEAIFGDLKKIVESYDNRITKSEEKSTEALNIARELNTTIYATRDMVNNLIIESGTSDAETIAMRTDTVTGITHSTAGERVDRISEMVAVNTSRHHSLYLHVTDYGAKGDGVTDDSVAIQECVDDAIQRNLNVYIPPGEYYISSPIVIHDVLHLKGAGEMRTILKAANSAIKIEIGRNWDRLYIGHLTLNGSHSNLNDQHIGIDFANTATISGADGTLENIRIFNFDLGMKLTYMWSFQFSNMRAQACKRPMRLNNQVNAILFNRCAFVSFEQSIVFTNCEGIQFNTCEFANMYAGTSALDLYQSDVLVLNPYFEYIDTGVLASVGSSGEGSPSTLIIEGGLVGGRVIVNNRKSIINIRGSRLHATKPLELLTYNDVAVSLPIDNVTICYHTNGIVQPVPVKPVVEWYGTKPIPFSAAWGGETVTRELKREGYSVVDSAQGLTIANNMTIGKQYTLVLRTRNNTSETIAIRDSGQMSLYTTPAGEAFETRVLTFVAKTTTLRYEFWGKIDAEYIGLFEGIVTNIALNKESHYVVTSQPAIDGWANGDIVFNQNSHVTGYIGWVFYNGTWKPFGKIDEIVNG